MRNLTHEEHLMIHWLVERYDSVEWTTDDSLRGRLLDPFDAQLDSKRHFVRDDGSPSCGAKIPSGAYVLTIPHMSSQSVLTAAYCRNCVSAIGGRLNLKAIIRKRHRL
jgi:hypothetical protein